jgi:NIPSNAP
VSNPLRFLCLSAVAVLFCFGPVALQAADEPMIYELRTYHCYPGKLPGLHARFRDHTMKLFEKHGIKNIAYWTPADQEDTLVYLIAHKNEAAAKESWKAFGSDPEWKKAQAESEKDGKLVMKVDRQFLNPTDYSPLK